MSIDLNALATWTYDAGILTYIPTPQSVTINIAANPALHTILSAPHWKNLGPSDVYSSDPDDWLERKIKWNRAQEDPPVLQIEQGIGDADFVNYNVYLLEDAPAYSDLFDNMASTLNDGVLNGYTKVHVRALLKDMVTAMQQFGLIGASE